MSEDRRAANIDDLQRMIEEDERIDKAELLNKMTPIEYARLRGMAPQRVYYYLRNKKLASETCQCGRRVIDVKDTDELLAIKKDFQGLSEKQMEIVEDAIADPTVSGPYWDKDPVQNVDCQHYGVECETNEDGNCDMSCSCTDCIQGSEEEIDFSSDDDDFDRHGMDGYEL